MLIYVASTCTVVAWRYLGWDDDCKKMFYFGGECLQSAFSKSKIHQSLLSISNGNSGPQPPTAVGGMPLGPWRVPGLNSAKCRATLSSRRTRQISRGYYYSLVEVGYGL